MSELKISYDFEEEPRVRRTAPTQTDMSGHAEPVRAGLRKARERLLDLSFKNRLINCDQGRAAPKKGRNIDSLRCIGDLRAVWSQLIDEEKKVRILTYDQKEQENISRGVHGRRPPAAPAPSERQTTFLSESSGRGLIRGGRGSSNRPALGEDDDVAAVFAKQIREGHLVGEPPHIEAQRRLERIWKKQNQFIESTGDSALFLAFGFLTWTESAGATSRQATSPLLLLHLELERSVPDRGGERLFDLNAEGQNVQSNPAMIAKIKRDYNITLPDYDPDVYDSWTSYVSAVEGAIRRQPAWSINPQMMIGFFNFAKYRMYLDLDETNWPSDQQPSTHPLIASLVSGEPLYSKRDGLLPDEGAVAATQRSADLPIVLEADATQYAALIAATKGTSLVIRGPPGTGKSQTITNLIASLIAQGQTVLFAAQKTTALNVVFDHLVSAGLEHACLPFYPREVASSGDGAGATGVRHRVASPAEINTRLRQSHEWRETGQQRITDEGTSVLAAALDERRDALAAPAHDLGNVAELLHLANSTRGAAARRWGSAWSDEVLKIERLPEAGTTNQWWMEREAILRRGTILAPQTSDAWTDWDLASVEAPHVESLEGLLQHLAVKIGEASAIVATTEPDLVVRPLHELITLFVAAASVPYPDEPLARVLAGFAVDPGLPGALGDVRSQLTSYLQSLRKSAEVLRTDLGELPGPQADRLAEPLRLLLGAVGPATKVEQVEQALRHLEAIDRQLQHLHELLRSEPSGSEVIGPLTWAALQQLADQKPLLNIPPGFMCALAVHLCGPLDRLHGVEILGSDLIALRAQEQRCNELPFLATVIPDEDAVQLRNAAAILSAASLQKVNVASLGTLAGQIAEIVTAGELVTDAERLFPLTLSVPGLRARIRHIKQTVQRALDGISGVDLRVLNHLACERASSWSILALERDIRSYRGLQLAISTACARCQPDLDASSAAADGLVTAWSRLTGRAQGSGLQLGDWCERWERLCRARDGWRTQSDLILQAGTALGLPEPDDLTALNRTHETVLGIVAPPFPLTEEALSRLSLVETLGWLTSLADRVRAVQADRQRIGVFVRLDRFANPDQCLSWRRTWLHYHGRLFGWFAGAYRESKRRLGDVLGHAPLASDMEVLQQAAEVVRRSMDLRQAPVELEVIVRGWWKGWQTSVDQLDALTHWLRHMHAAAAQRSDLRLSVALRQAGHPAVVSARDSSLPTTQATLSAVWRAWDGTSLESDLSLYRLSANLERAISDGQGLIEAARTAGVPEHEAVDAVVIGLEQRSARTVVLERISHVQALDEQTPWLSYDTSRLVSTADWFTSWSIGGGTPDVAMALSSETNIAEARNLLSVCDAWISLVDMPTGVIGEGRELQHLVDNLPWNGCAAFAKPLTEAMRFIASRTGVLPGSDQLELATLHLVLETTATWQKAVERVTPWHSICQRQLVGADHEAVRATLEWVKQGRAGLMPNSVLLWVVGDPQANEARAHWTRQVGTAARAASTNWRAALDRGITPGQETSPASDVMTWHQHLRARLVTWQSALQNLSMRVNARQGLTLQQVQEAIACLRTADAIARNLAPWDERLGAVAIQVSPERITAHQMFASAALDLEAAIRKRLFTTDPTGAIAEMRDVAASLKQVSSAIHMAQSAMTAIGDVRGSGPLRCNEIDTNLSQLGPCVEFLRKELPALLPTAEMVRARMAATRLGIRFLFDAVTQHRVDGDAAVTALHAAVRTGQARMTVAKHPVLMRGGDSYADQRKEFGRSVKRMIEGNRKRVGNQVRKRAIDPGQTGRTKSQWTGLALLQNEWNKQKKRLPIRRVVERASDAMRGLCPVWLMTPLAIAQFLPSGISRFDVVVMDEASQLDPEDALGAVLRADQAVIVGDPKQMPPSDLFASSTDDDDDDETDEDFADAVKQESILDMAANAFIECGLQWHYRSKHERLIAPANALSYENSLVLFPSARKMSDELGIRYRRVENGVFTPKVNVNQGEAEVVLDRLEELLRASEHAAKPDDAPSIGVVTMNLKQQQLIDDLLAQRCKDNPPLAELFRRQAEMRNDERLTIKNLENFQGDQRDVMILAMTYGPDVPGGKVKQHFRSIGGNAGHRRFNVLITRAKLRMEVFVSFASSDVTPSIGETALGRTHLKHFLAYCESGGETSVFPELGRKTDHGTDSPFEDEVSLFLTSGGFRIENNVGVAGYRVDIGVHHPRDPGRYAIGIECDGARYHSSRSARDRDKNRQEILESRGWIIYRVWSTDWFQNRVQTQKRLVEAINRAIRT